MDKLIADLLHQIALSDFTDEHGHKLANNASLSGAGGGDAMTAKRKVVPFPIHITRRNRMAVGKVLKAAMTAKLAKVTLIGFHDDGKIYMASNTDAPDTLWDMEYAKKWLLSGCPEEGGDE